MNQIICTSNTYLDTINLKKVQRRKIILRIELCVLIIICLLLLIYYVNYKYNLYISKNISKNLENTYKITKIYNSIENNTETNDDQIILYENNSFKIIGAIEIKKLNISYPILSDISKEYLKIAPCRIYGPMPNKIRKFMHCRTQL